MSAILLGNITDCPDGSDELGCDDDFYKCNEYKGTVHAITMFLKYNPVFDLFRTDDQGRIRVAWDLWHF